MLNEYGALIEGAGLISVLGGFPSAVISFLYTQKGQVVAGLLLVVLFFLFGRR